MSDDKGYRVGDQEPQFGFDYDAHLRKEILPLQPKHDHYANDIENVLRDHPAINATITNSLINSETFHTDSEYYRFLLEQGFSRSHIKQHIIQTNGAIIALLMRGAPDEAQIEFSDRLDSQDMRFLMKQLPPSKQATIIQKIDSHCTKAANIARKLETLRSSSNKIKHFLFENFEKGRDKSANLMGYVTARQYYGFPVFFVPDSSFSILFHGGNGYCALGKNGMPYFVIKQSYENQLSMINHELTHAVCKYVFPEYDNPQDPEQSPPQITLQTIKHNVKEEIIAYTQVPSSKPVGYSLSEILLHEKIYDYSGLYYKGSPQEELTKRIQAVIKVLSLNALYIAGQAQGKNSDKELLNQLSQRPLDERQDYALSLLASLKHGQKSHEAILSYAAEKSMLKKIQSLPEFARYFDSNLSMHHAQTVYLAAMQGLL